MAGSGKSSKIADVLIVGAGASGLIAMKHLAESGFDVVCLEQGPRVDPSEYWGDKPEWELVIGKRWHANPNIRDLEADYPIDVSESDTPVLMYNAVGGTTIIYAGHWHRFVPSDFRVKTLDGVADDWPFTYEDLAPYYDQIDIEMGVSGYGGDPAFPPMPAPPLPQLPIGKIGMKAAQGMNKLGWHWWPASNSLPSLPYEGRNACTRRGTCITGCPEGAKASTNLTHLPSALKHGARLISGARVREILVNDEGLARGAAYIDRNGREREQLARTVIVCCNGVGTPRLLLLSKSAKFPDGLANSSGLVGKNLMTHPYRAVNGYFDEPLESWLGPAGQSIYTMQFYETDASRGFVRGCKWHVRPFQASGGPLGAVVGPSAGMTSASGRAMEEAWGASLHRATRKALGRSFHWGCMGEDLPEESNQVVLDRTLTDSDGIPAPKVIYKTSQNSHKMLDFNVARAREAMEAAGAVDMEETGLLVAGHLMGTCRMGTDPQKSVLNQWGQAHDVPNLFVYDGSTFVTSSGFNPTGTICAIALRCVKHLITERRDQKVAA